MWNATSAEPGNHHRPRDYPRGRCLSASEVLVAGAALRASGGDRDGNSFPLLWRTPRLEDSGIGQIEARQPDAIMGQQVGWDLLAQLHDEATTTGIPVLVVSTDPKLLAWRGTRHRDLAPCTTSASHST